MVVKVARLRLLLQHLLRILRLRLRLPLLVVLSCPLPLVPHLRLQLLRLATGCQKSSAC